VLVGLGEEMWFRSYLLRTLRRGAGFWAAAILLSLWFTGEHYCLKQGENVWDYISLFAFGMFACFTVLQNRLAIVRCRAARRVRLHAALRHRYAQGRPSAGRALVERIVPDRRG
jgi:hypothetical protein